MWHASIARLTRTGPVPLDDVDRTAQVVMVNHAEALLDGVGVDPDHWHRGRAVVHLRRRLSDDELERIDQAWLAIPPRDLGGGEDDVWTPPR